MGIRLALIYSGIPELRRFAPHKIQRTISRMDEESFKRSFGNWVKEQLSGNPVFLDRKKLVAEVKREARKRLDSDGRLAAFAGLLNERGDITMTALSQQNGTFEELVVALRKRVRENLIRAVCTCRIVERMMSDGKQYFFELHLEHRESQPVRGKRLALRIGVPVSKDQSERSQGYKKGAPFLIFQTEEPN